MGAPPTLTGPLPTRTGALPTLTGPLPTRVATQRFRPYTPRGVYP